MRGTFPLLFLKRKSLDGMIGDDGSPIAWKTGQPIETVQAFDIDTEQTVSLTVDPDFAGQLPTETGAHFDGLVRVTSRDGKVKYRLLAIAA